MEYLRYLGPRPDYFTDWLNLACVAVVLIGLIMTPQFNKIQKLFWFGITCIAFGVASLSHQFSPRLGGLCYAVIGLACIWLAIRLYASLAASKTSVESPLQISSGQAVLSLPQIELTQLLPDSTTRIKQLPDRIS